jgi:phosphinothricin acetyltransferase
VAEPPSTAATLREARAQDAEAICAIYNPFVLDSCVSFEETASGGSVQAYAYAVPWRARPAYRHSVECSVYVAPEVRRRGHGRRLYQALFERLRAAGMHSVIAGIALPNEASVALHEAMGMHKVAHFAQVGRKFGRWVDVGYWQREL